MGIMEKLVNLISPDQEVPQMFGDLHLAFCFGVIAACLLLSVFFRDASDGTFRLLIAVMFLVMLVGEVMKQFVYPFSIVDGVLVKDYDWSTFPFQLCSTPLYVLPLIALLPDCKLRDCAACYIMTYGLIGGVAVYLTPYSVFATRVFINIQTMVHHGLQIVSGVYIASYYRRRINKSFYHGGVAVFVVTFTIANLLNTVFYDMLIAKGKIPEGYQFNMFYISPRVGLKLPFFADTFNTLPPITYIAGYFVILSVGAFIVCYVANLLFKFARRSVSIIDDEDEDA